MPDAAPHFCAIPGCSVLTTRRKCPAHNVEAEHARENWAVRRWYRSPRWKALRARVIRDHAYQCARCRKVTDRLEVDHILKHEGDANRFWNVRNLQALCKACHSRKTQRGE